MYIGICDDDEIIHNEIVQLLNQQKLEVPMVIVPLTNLQDLMEWEQELDVLFLDIEVGNQNSLEYLKQHENMFSSTMIVLVSSHTCYVTKSYQVSVMQFLLKPIRYEQFELVFHDCYQKYRKMQQLCELKDVTGEIWQIPVQKVVCVKYINRKLVFYLEDNNIYYGPSNMSLSKLLEEKLKFFGFGQARKDCIINLAYVTGFVEDNLLIEFKQKTGRVNVSKKYLKELQVQYLRYCADLEGI